MRTLFDFVYGNFMTLFNRVVANLRELSTTLQVALAVIAVALIFIAVMILIYVIRASKHRTIKKIENVDVVFFNSVWEFEPYTKAKEGNIVFILLIPFTFVINLVVKVFMFRAFSAINSSDYITRRMLENMQLENMRMKDKNKELLKMIDEAGLNRKPRKPAPRPKKEAPKKEEPKKEEPKIVAEEKAPVKEEAKVVKKETKTVAPEPKKEAKKPEPKKDTPKEEIKKEEPVKEAAPKVEEEVVTSSTIVTENDKEPEVILATTKVEEPIMPDKEIIDAEIIDPENDNIDELIEDVKVKETRGKA